MNLYATVLREILAKNGRGVCDDPNRLKALLRDGLGPHPGKHEQPINVLVLALENRAVAELLGSPGVPAETVQQRLSARLRTSLGLNEKVADWTVATWAAALAAPPAAAPAAAAPKPAAQPVAAGRPTQPPSPAVTTQPVAAAGPKPVTQPVAASRPTQPPPPIPTPADQPPAPGRLASVTDPIHSGLAAPSTLPPAQPAAAPPPTVAFLQRLKLALAVTAGLFFAGLCAGVGTALLIPGSSSPHTDKLAANQDAAANTIEPKKPPDSWKMIFRSSDPTIWNDDINKGPDHFAMATELAPDGIRYLRLTDTSSKEFVIIEMSKSQLSKTGDSGRYRWQGSNYADCGARHLGIIDFEARARQRGDISIIGFPHDRRGWGFGHKFFVNDVQGYSWNGNIIGSTVFEIAVKTEPLTDTEAKKLLRD